MDNCGIFEKFDLENNLIKEYNHWYLLVRKKQKNIGSCVAILKRHAFPLREATREELSEYASVVVDVENATKNSYGSYLTQHLCLMFVDKHVHFHILPRYQSTITIDNKEWVDCQDPNPLNQPDTECSIDELLVIKNSLQKFIK